MTEPPSSSRRTWPRHHLPALLWTLAVAVLLLLPGDAMTESDRWDWVDLPAHVALFAVHYGLLVRSLRATGIGRPGILAAALSGLWGLAMEAAQIAVPGRSGELLDLAADLAGIGLGALVLATLRARLTARS